MLIKFTPGFTVNRNNTKNNDSISKGKSSLAQFKQFQDGGYFKMAETNMVEIPKWRPNQIWQPLWNVNSFQRILALHNGNTREIAKTPTDTN